MECSVEGDSVTVESMAERQASADSVRVELSVYRRLDNRFEGLPDSSHAGSSFTGPERRCTRRLLLRAGQSKTGADG